MKTEPNDQAFATPNGLTKREYFAALAMQGMLANENSWHVSEYTIAQAAIGQADALINELNKENQQ